MNQIFHDGLYTRVVIFIDDILVFGKTTEELIANTRWVFEKCRGFIVKLKRSKCEFVREQVQFLGFSISEDRISPVKDKCDPAFDKAPANIVELQRILGILNYYNRFIPNFAERTKPLRDLTRKDKLFRWTDKESGILANIQTDLNDATANLIPH